MPLTIKEIASAVQSAIQPVAVQLAGNYLSTQMGYPTGTVTNSYLSASAQLLSGPDKLPLIVPDSARQSLKFRIMVQEWKRETGHLSSMTKTVLHPVYQAIIGMGKPALPLIFDQLQRDRGHWLWALHAITQEDPARGRVDFDEAIEAWLQWGKDHGYL